MSSLRHILITGATGYLGSRLANRLLSLGFRVSVLVRQGSKLDRLNQCDNLLIVRIDESPLSALFAELTAKAGPLHAVIHCATIYGRDAETTLDVFNTNTVFALTVLEAAIKQQVPLFINTGTSLPPELNAYSLSKAHFLDWLRNAANSKEWLRAVNFKLEHFYGSGDDASKFTTHVIRSCLEGAGTLNLTRGEQQRDFIHIDDVVSAYLTVLERAAPGYSEYGLGSGVATTVREFVEKVKAFSGSKTELRFGTLAYRPNEVLHSCADTAAIRALGWSPIYDLDRGLYETIQQETAN